MLPITTYVLAVSMITLCAIIYFQHKEIKKIQKKFEEMREADKVEQ